jgi:glucose-fructose oxidoreductase
MQHDPFIKPAEAPAFPSGMISRRTMVKGVALGSAGLVLAPDSLLSACRTKKVKLGVALVGLGYYSTDLLAPALQQTKNCCLAGIVTGTPAKAEAWKKKYNIPDKNIYDYGSFDRIADNRDIDVVYVVLPPSLHREYTVRAANAGKHVWCEKPMAVTAQECREMIDSCQKNKVSLAIGYRLHHDPNTQEWRKIVKQKLLGNVKGVKCGSGYTEGRVDHWKQKKEMGGGVLHDMGVYSIQGARMGAGAEPTAIVTARAYTTRPEIYKDGLAEIVEATLEFPGNVLAQIKTSFGENINYLEIEGEKGLLRVSPHQAYAGVKASSPLGEINHPYSVPWQQARQMDDDALAILQGKPVMVPGEEGLRDIRIVEAIYQSAATGQRVGVS